MRPTTFQTQILGPHFEDLARDWTRRLAAPETLGGAVGAVGAVGRTVLADREQRARHEIDVVALAAGERPRTPGARVLALGEAKSSQHPRGAGDLARLERGRALLVERGVDAASARLLLFGRSGFDPRLVREAAGRRDLELVDLERLYTGA